MVKIKAPNTISGMIMIITLIIYDMGNHSVLSRMLHIDIYPNKYLIVILLLHSTNTTQEAIRLSPEIMRVVANVYLKCQQ